MNLDQAAPAVRTAGPRGAPNDRSRAFPGPGMNGLRTLVATGLAVMLSACAGGSGPSVPERPGLALRTAGEAVQAPVVDVDGKLHVGADVAPPAGELSVIARHGEARVAHGSVRDGIGAAELIAYLQADASSYASPDEEEEDDVDLFPGGLVFRFASSPPTVRVAHGASPELLDETVRVVQAINAALPRDWQLGLREATGPAGTHEPADGEILVTFAPQAEWPPELMAPTDGDIGLAEPRYSIAPTSDPEMPLGIEIVAGRIWVDPSQTGGLERLGVLAHEILHVLGRGHVDPERFPGTLMVGGGSDELSAHILHPLDREALLAVYGHLEPGTRPGLLADELGPWSDTSMHVRGAVDAGSREISFGAAFRNGLAQPWAAGPTPRSSLEASASLSGRVGWTGRVLGFTPRAETVAGAAYLGVDLATLRGTVELSELEHWAVGAAPGAAGSGASWLDGDLSYEIEVRGNVFARTAGDAGSVTGSFFGPAHEGMGGVVVRDDLSAGFGGKR